VNRDVARNFNPARGYALFDDICRSMERWVHRRAPGTLGYGQPVLARRLTQRLVELTLHPFLQQSGERYQSGLPPVPENERVLRCGGLTVGLDDGRVTPGPYLMVRSTLEFLSQWMRMLWVFARALRGRPKRKTAYVVVFGVSVESVVAGGSDSQFARFLGSTELTPLRDAECLMIECPQPVKSVEPARIVYAKYPLFEILRRTSPAPGDAMTFLAEHFRALGAFLRVVLRLPVACVLARDFAFHALVQRLNDRGALDSIVFTNSHFHVQPLWMRERPGRRFSCHMVWYSQNSIPFVYRADGVQAPVPNFRHIDADCLWVWTEGFARYLESIGLRGPIRAAGPIVWSRPERAPVPAADGSLSVVIFDVTPQTPEFVYEVGLLYNYYRSENVTKFVEDILTVRDELENQRGHRIRLVIKQKRNPNPRHHDPRYLKFIDGLVETGRLTMVPPDTEVFSLVQAASAIVVIPYSSPAYLGAFLGVPAVYYDPTEEIVPVYEASPWLQFAAGRFELRSKLAAALGPARS
jgi:hypothetical protein